MNSHGLFMIPLAWFGVYFAAALAQAVVVVVGLLIEDRFNASMMATHPCLGASIISAGVFKHLWWQVCNQSKPTRVPTITKRIRMCVSTALASAIS